MIWFLGLLAVFSFVVLSSSFTALALGTAWTAYLLVLLFTSFWRALKYIFCTVFGVMFAMPVLYLVCLILGNTIMTLEQAEALLWGGDAITVTAVLVGAACYRLCTGD